MWKIVLIVCIRSAICWPYQVGAELVRDLSNDGGSGDGEKGLLASLLPPTCTAAYYGEKGHTMCMYDDNRVSVSGVSETTRRSIVALHNSLRAKVQPPATDLTMLTWDDNLAAVASKWAKQCVIGHDANRIVPSYGMVIGQNVAAGHRSWQDAIMSWYNEVDLYQYGREPKTYLGPNGWKKIGHYTQMVQNDTYRIGCGFADCVQTPYGRYYVCNYAKGQSRLSFPYSEGIRCSACPNSCWKGLCDCNGKLCLNQGKLNPDTCTCNCPQIYGGSNCSQLNCPSEDPFYCGRDLVLADCQVYANVPHLCPYMCGVCETTSAPNHEDDSTDDGADDEEVTSRPPLSAEVPFISPFNCSYWGARGTNEECRSYGDNGMDMGFCASKGGQFQCNDCNQYYNIKRDYCPVMCGLCDAPCDGKICEHDGRLNPDTCQCNCTKIYEGEICETLNCPAEEKWHCSIFPERFCHVYKNVPTDCPYLCGICTRETETTKATKDDEER